MEKSRSWPSAHDWKSCIPQKGIEGSNPSFSAIAQSPRVSRTLGFFFTLLADLLTHKKAKKKEANRVFGFW